MGNNSRRRAQTEKNKKHMKKKAKRMRHNELFASRAKHARAQKRIHDTRMWRGHG
jgi:hypothetical protein